MKLRRLIALLMAALMLLAMIPAAKAQAIWCPDLGWEHAWSTPEYDYGPCEWGFRYCTRCGAGSEVPPQHKWVTQTIEQPDCTEPGWKESLCANCGDERGDRQEIPALGHNWGSWRWVHGEPPCNSNGAWQVRDCQRCGQQEDRWIEGGAHAFGPWYSTQEPTCMAPGRQEHTCTLCGHTEWTTIPQLEHVFGEWRVVEEPQVGLPGYERRFCIYQCGTYEERVIPPLEEAISQSGLALTLVLSSTPANGTHFVVGEKVTFTETWANNSDQTLYPFSVSIFTCAAPAYGSAVDQISSWFAEDAGGPVAPGASGSHMLTVTVTEADVARGAIYAMAELLSTVQDGPDLGNVATPFVIAPCAPIVEPEAKMTKYVSVIPANGEYFVPGETIEYAVVFMNVTEHELHDVEVYDPLKGSNEDITITREPVVPPNGVLYLSFRYVVTEEDAARGTVVNTASAIWLNPETEEWSSCDSNTVTTLCGSTDNAAAAPCLTVDMTYTNTPANGEFFTPGEVINYLITVTNTGDVPLTDLQVGNSASEAVVPAPSEIAPGQTIQVPYYKLVYEENAKAGGIDSYGHANAFNGDPALPESLVSGRSADVFVPCGKGNGSPSVYYLKIVANAPANGLFFTEGETIKYRLSFGNNTKKDIYNITLNDPMANTRSVAFARRLKAGEFLMGEFEYIVTAADVEAGQIVNTGTSTWATKAEGAQTTTPSNTVVTPTGVDQPAELTPDALLEKYVKNTPANGEYFVPGETIEYAVVFMNVNDHELHDVEVYDPLKGSNEDITISREPIVEPNGTLYLSFNYVVTEEDAARGTVVNTASAIWLNPETEEWSSCDSNTVITDVGMPEGVSLIKTIENAPANGQFFVPGEAINFVITVQNSMGKTLDVVVLTDPLSAYFYHELLDIPVGAVDSRTLSYTVTELDAAIGSVTNCAYAVAYADGTPHSLTSNTVTAPCGFPDTDGNNQPDDPYGIHTWLDVTKEVESLPMNGQFYVEGETVAYKITYTNAGESVLMDVRIYDALVGMAEIATAEYMEPGDSRVCYLNYTVTAEDTQRGHITNTAIGQYVMHDYVNTFYSNEVTVKTNYFKYVTITPDVTEDPGTIDHGKLPLGESSCVRTITGKDNASASYETTFCADHVATQSSVMLMTQAATTPEAQVQAATYAAILWRTEAAKLYQQLLDAADNQGKITVMTEYIHFAAMVSNYAIVLKNIYPDQPALVAQLIAKLWEDKCVTLCYEIHTAADARTDSLLSVTATTGAAADCACTVTAETAGTKAYTQSFCAAHAFPFSMIDMVLQGQDTAAGWQMVRQIWMVELNGTYNKVNTVLAGNSDLTLAEFNATMQWLEAREAYLNALYPDNPELVAQTMVKHIMDRVNDLCPALK